MALTVHPGFPKPSLSAPRLINDDKTSAFLAVRALLATAKSLTKLAKHKPLGLKPKFSRLAKTALNLAEAINMEFELGVI